MSLQSPNPLLYYIGKGKVSFRKSGDSDFRDLGNCPVFEIAPNITRLDHYSSRSGVKTKDKTVTTEKSGTLNMTLEEWSFENLRLALLGGAAETNSSGSNVFTIFSADQIEGEMKFVGTNDVGPRYEILLPNVSFVPGKSLSPISDGWGTLELIGQLLLDSATNGFGTLTELTDGASNETPSV